MAVARDGVCIAMTFLSSILDLGRCRLPEYSGTRVMMMPYFIADPDGSLPQNLKPSSPGLVCSG